MSRHILPGFGAVFQNPLVHIARGGCDTKNDPNPLCDGRNSLLSWPVGAANNRFRFGWYTGFPEQSGTIWRTPDFGSSHFLLQEPIFEDDLLHEGRPEQGGEGR